MSLTLVSRPPSVHSSANPAVFKFTRKDAIYYNRSNNAGNLRLVFNEYGTSDNFTIGDTVTIVDTNGNVINTEVINVSVYAGYPGSGLITFDYPYSLSISITGYAILRTKRVNYKLVCQVLDYDTGEEVGPELSFTPKSDGSVSANVSAAVSKNLSPELSYSDLTSEDVEKDDNKKFRYRLRYREKWTGSDESPSYTEDNTAIFSARQVLQDTDMSEYLCTDNTSKFLTSFDIMRMVRGMYFTVPVLADPQGGSSDSYPFIFANAFSPAFA